MSLTGKSLGNKVVLAKIPREEYTKFQQYCDANEETINSFLRRKILDEIDNPQTIKIAGKSVFEYNKLKDNFSWKVTLDDNSSFSIDDNLPADAIEQFLESSMNAVNERRRYIKKETKNSVSIPSKLRKMKNEK
jgi:hypothetical protein|tara:strand:+ start:299 stop:700 length:402 start_codon:yes stop_codon:yes gene_type:complete